MIFSLFVLVLFGCSDPEETGVMETEIVDDGNVHDALSMPQNPTLDVYDFLSATSCEECHPDHYEEWRTSNHAYAMVDPLYQTLVNLRQQDLNATEDQFCTQCHSAIGTRGGECVSGFNFDDLSYLVMEGITCESCHKVSSIERPYNSGHVFDPTGPQRGSIKDPVETSYHESEYDPMFAGSEFCGGCHDVVETSGLNLERPYQEWLESPAYDEDRPCQECHMPVIEGKAATDGPVRDRHEHRWIGVDVAALPGFLTEEETEYISGRVSELLDTAATLSLTADLGEMGSQVDVNVSITNEIDAHALPTGSTFLRQVWIELIAFDAKGEMLFETGLLDANDDLKDAFSEIDPYGDDDLITLSSNLLDDHGNPEFLPWKASEHVLKSLSPGYTRTYTLFVPVDKKTAWPIQVEARLRLRPFAPWLLRLTGQDDYLENLRTYDLASDVITVKDDL